MNTAIIGLGSNIDPEQNIAKARNILRKTFTILSESQFIQTKPIGFSDQDDFINGSVLLETSMTFETLKTELKNIEIKMGRKTSDIKSGPRSIDMDIVVFNRQITDPDFYERDFLKKAVLELIPDLEY